LIIEKLQRHEGFTNSEEQIASYVLGHLADIPDISARELGARSYTSKASIFRFCRKLQFSGYKEFQRKIEIEYRIYNRTRLALEKEPVNKYTTLEDIFAIIPSLYASTFDAVNLGIDEVSFRRIIKHIRQASAVDLYGSGITYICATAAKFKLRSLGIDCNTYSGINEHYVRATGENKNKVAIMLSFTGANKSMIEMARYVKASGFFVVGIGGIESHDLRNACDEYIEVNPRRSILSMEVVTPYIGITYVFDLLLAALLAADFEKNVNVALDVLSFRETLKA
jgi:DNA-binding MurR/RpiR family transcriptional regulator